MLTVFRQLLKINDGNALGSGNTTHYSQHMVLLVYTANNLAFNCVYS